MTWKATTTSAKFQGCTQSDVYIYTQTVTYSQEGEKKSYFKYKSMAAKVETCDDWDRWEDRTLGKERIKKGRREGGVMEGMRKLAKTRVRGMGKKTK